MRRYPKGHQAASLRHVSARHDRRPEAFDVRDGVVGGHGKQQRRVVGRGVQGFMRGQGQRRRRVATLRLQHHRGRLYACFAQLVQHEKSVRLVAHDDRRRAPVEADKPHGGFLQQGALADEREELLRHVLAGQRPEPAARTAGKDHGL